MMGDESMKGEDSSRRRSPKVGCDYCNEEEAILYCRADSAKLCVMCDQHVHSANPLSLKHIRSQICHNCHSQPVSFLCLSDNLFLCQDCDSDAHALTLHNRVPVHGFSGCPSPSQLASHLGIHFENLLLQHHANYSQFQSNTNKSYHYEEDDVDDQFMVPTTKALPQASTATITSTTTNTTSCGNVVVRQLIHLYQTQQRDDNFQIHHQEEEEEGEDEDDDEEDNHDSRNEDTNSLLLTQSLTSQQQLPFTSLLMQQQVCTSTSTSQLDVVDQGGFEPGEAGQMLWNTQPSDQGTQVSIFASRPLLLLVFSFWFQYIFC